MSEVLLPVEPWPPAGAQLAVEFVVLGRAKPAGSKTGHVVRRGDGSLVMKDGKPIVVNRDSSGALGEAWRQQVALVAADVWARVVEVPEAAVLSADDLLDGPLAFEVTFVLQRPKSHYRTGRNAHLLRDSAPRFPATMPDSLKLRRAVEDSLKSTVYRDDALIVDGRDRKVFGTPERAEVRVWALPALAASAVAAGQAALAVA